MEKVGDHAEVELKYMLPETAIIHAGGNDLANKIDIDEIADNAACIGLELKAKGIKNIAISGMTPRVNLKDEIPKLNCALVAMCQTYGFDYIDNSNIKYSYRGFDGSFKYHICNDLIHLNHDGVEILQSNFIGYLRKSDD